MNGKNGQQQPRTGQGQQQQPRMWDKDNKNSSHGSRTGTTTTAATEVGHGAQFPWRRFRQGESNEMESSWVRDRSHGIRGLQRPSRRRFGLRLRITIRIGYRDGGTSGA
jgi:hypothetical protein